MSSAHALQLLRGTLRRFGRKKGETGGGLMKKKKSKDNRQEIQAARAKRQEMVNRGQAEAQRTRQEAQEVVEQRVRAQE